MFKGGLHGALGDFVKGHALDARRRLRLSLFGFLGFLLFATVLVEFVGKVRGLICDAASGESRDDEASLEISRKFNQLAPKVRQRFERWHEVITT